MKILFLILLISAAGVCIPTPNEESQNSQNNERWFFWAVDWHPNKDQFIVGGSNDSFLKLFSSNDYQQLKKYPYKGTITKTKWHPTQNKVAISVQDGKSKQAILNLDTDERIVFNTITNEGARAIGWNRSGELLAIGDYNGFLTIFDEAGNELKKVNTSQKSIIGLDWHPNENLIVAVGEDVILYHYETDSLKRIVDRNEEVEVLMLSAAWHPGGKFFVTGDYGIPENNYPPLLQYWSYDGEKLKAINVNKAEIRNIAWSSDGELLATASDKLRLWNKEGKLIAEQATKNLLWGIAWNNDGSTVVATDVEKKIIVWDRDLNRLKELQY